MRRQFWKLTEVSRISILKKYYSQMNGSDGKSTNNDCQIQIKEVSKKENFKIPEAPTTCCMSGCANCVWIQYAEELSKHFQDNIVDGDDKKIQKIILEQIDDQNMKAFLAMELRVRNQKS